MTPLRQRMLEDMKLRNLSASTQANYVRYVADLARYTHRIALSNHRLVGDEWRNGHLHLQELQNLRHQQDHAPRGHRVHPTLPAARFAQRIPTHPLLRIHGQLPPDQKIVAVPPPAPRNAYRQATLARRPIPACTLPNHNGHQSLSMSALSQGPPHTLRISGSTSTLPRLHYIDPGPMNGHTPRKTLASVDTASQRDRLPMPLHLKIPEPFPKPDAIRLESFRVP